jgi:hypothetical protein
MALKSKHCLAGSLLRSHKAAVKALARLCLSGEESTPKLIQVVGRTNFLVTVGLISLFPC